VLEGNSGISKNKGTSLCNFVQNSGLRENFSTATAFRPSQVLYTQVDVHCDKLATVVVISRQFITMSVHLYVQHDGRNACSALRRSVSGSWDLCVELQLRKCADFCTQCIVASL